jgi:hypothetical protein
MRLLTFQRALMTRVGRLGSGQPENQNDVSIDASQKLQAKTALCAKTDQIRAARLRLKRRPSRGSGSIRNGGWNARRQVNWSVTKRPQMLAFSSPSPLLSLSYAQCVFLLIKPFAKQSGNMVLIKLSSFTSLRRSLLMMAFLYSRTRREPLTIDPASELPIPPP